MGQCSGHPGHVVKDDGSMNAVTGQRKALLVGINYVGTNSSLRGCINDIKNQKECLIEQYGFKEENIVMLSEDEEKANWPTKARILKGFQDLYTGARSGDLLFFQYSGHGSQCRLWQGTMADCICPLDCLDGGWPGTVILDSEIHEHFYDPLPSGCKAVALFDCCHSGTVANLSIKRALGGGEPAPVARYLAPKETTDTKAELPPVHGIRNAVVSEKYAGHQLWVFSGCQDDQTSADAWIGGVPQGAFTWAFVKALKTDIWHETYIDLLHQVRNNLKGRYTQIPALTTTHSSYLNMWYCGKTGEAKHIIPAAEKVGKKRALLIGINYRKTPNELRGCINDIVNQKALLERSYGFKESEMMILSEDQDRADWPFKQRMLEGFKWLVDGASEGDVLFLHYSGHGSQMSDCTGKELSGLSDCICPLDCNKPWPQHIILDTEIHTYLYDKVPEGVNLTCVFDCCHSGTVANLPVTREMGPMVPQQYRVSRYYPAPKSVAEPPTKSMVSRFACSQKGADSECKEYSGFRRVLHDQEYNKKNVWVYSGCQDDQTSADAFEDGQYQGAFTWAFIQSLEYGRFSCRHIDLLNQIRRVLRAGYRQVPALSSTSREQFARYFLAQRGSYGLGRVPCM